MSANENKPSKLANIFGRLGKKPESVAEESELNDREELAEEPKPAGTDIEHELASVVEDSVDLSESLGAVEEIAEENKEIEQDESLENRGDGIFSRWRKGLNKTGQKFGSAMGGLLRNRTRIDDELLEEIETQLLMADVGLETTGAILEELKKRVKSADYRDQDLYQVLKGLLVDMLSEGDRRLNIEPGRTNVLMIVGVNGVGKTTSIGKLANQFKSEGQSLVLAAGDTFRAAAVEQLQVWGERNEIPVIAQSTGADSASVIYDALESSRARSADIVIADTAGRLHNKDNLMEELGKVVRVMQKQDASAPHETLLVLDACTGQNAINQAREFAKAVPLTGIILTKMDGTAKGGVIFSLVQQTGLSVKFVGLGEGINDLAAFDPNQFVNALFASVDAD